MIEAFYDELLKISMGVEQAAKSLAAEKAALPTTPQKRMALMAQRQSPGKGKVIPPPKGEIPPLGGKVSLPGGGGVVPKDIVKAKPAPAPLEGKPVGAPSSKPIPELAPKAEATPAPAPPVQKTEAPPPPPPPAPKDPAPTTTTVSPAEGAPAATPASAPFWNWRRKLMLAGAGIGGAGMYAGYQGIKGYQRGSAEGEEERRRRGLP